MSVLLLGLACSGCSFIFVTAPPPRAEQATHPSAECTTSRAAPIVDGIIAGYQVIRTVYATQAPDSTYKNLPISRGADIGLGLAFTALFLSSTIYGGVVTSACKEFKAQADLQLRDPSSPSPTRPQPAVAPAPPSKPAPKNDAPAAPDAPPTVPSQVPEGSPPPAVAPPPPAVAPPAAASFPPAK